MTLGAAKVLGVEADLGSLEKGKLANLVFASGDILQASTQIAGRHDRRPAARPDEQAHAACTTAT